MLDFNALLQGGLGKLLQGQPNLPDQAAPPQAAPAPPQSVLDTLGQAPAPPSAMDIGQPPAPGGQAPQQAAPQAAPMSAFDQQYQQVANRKNLPFLQRLGVPEAVGGLSFLDRVQDLGNTLMDGAEGTDRADRTQRARLDRQQQEYTMQTQQGMATQAAQLFPGDKKMAFLARYAPAEFAKMITPVKLAPGERLASPMGVGQGGAGGDGASQEIKDGLLITYDPDGHVVSTVAAPPNAGAAETGRHNQAQEGIDAQRLGIDKSRLGIDQQNAGVNAGRLNLEGNKFGFDKVNEALKRYPNAVLAVSPAQVQALKPGTTFVAPDGTVKVR